MREQVIVEDTRSMDDPAAHSDILSRHNSTVVGLGPVSPTSYFASRLDVSSSLFLDPKFKDEQLLNKYLVNYT